MKNMNERSNFVFEFRPVTELFEKQVKFPAIGEKKRIGANEHRRRLERISPVGAQIPHGPMGRDVEQVGARFRSQNARGKIRISQFKVHRLLSVTIINV